MSYSPDLNSDTAYLIGVVAGDGCITKYISSKRTDYKVEVFGDLIDEPDFFKILIKLFSEQFGIIPKLIVNKDCLRLRLNFKFILEFFEENGLKAGKKARIIQIPKKIKQNKKFLLSFMRGLADTDFCLTFKKRHKQINYYPVISAEFASNKLIQDICEVISMLGISYTYTRRIRKTGFGNPADYPSFCININGIENLKKWMDSIGFRNPKHLTKLILWQKTGFCPAHTKYPERINILKNIPVAGLEFADFHSVYENLRQPSGSS
ncbi:hypothetical protein GF358_04630 [Candidatus Woesearchaeota archaeon]|nr:hypothetical protein [Candidatus Woesearchaeota archaeon]